MSNLSKEQMIKVQYDFFNMVYSEILDYMKERNIETTNDIKENLFRIENNKDKDEKKRKINLLNLGRYALDLNTEIIESVYPKANKNCIRLLIEYYYDILSSNNPKKDITDTSIRKRFNSFTQNKNRTELYDAMSDLLGISSSILKGLHPEITIAFAEKAYYYNYDRYFNDEYYDMVTEQEEMLWLEEFYTDYQKFNKKEKTFIWDYIDELTVNLANLYDILENLELLNKKGRSAFYTYLNIAFPTKFRKQKYHNTSINSNYNTFVALLESFNAVTAKKPPTKEMIFRKLKPFASVKYTYIISNTVLISTKDELILEVFKLLTVLSAEEYSMFKVFLNHLQSISEYKSQKNRL